MIPIIIQPELKQGLSLFRYMKEEHLRDFRKEGILRLSRLSYYHQIEKLGHAIGDKYEGTSTVNLKVDFFQKTVTNSPPSSLSVLFPELGNGAIIKNLNIGNANTSNKNLFCLSMSLKRSKELQSDFYADGYFEIKKPDKFFKAICKSVNGLTSALLVKCEYTGRVKNYNMLNHDDDWLKYPYLKEPAYGYQYEVRGLWEVPDILNDHIFLKCYDATRYCKF